MSNAATSALCPASASAFAALREFVRLAPVEDDGCAGVREAARDGKAQSSIGAGDKGDAAGEVEQCDSPGNAPATGRGASRLPVIAMPPKIVDITRLPMTAASTMPQTMTTSV